MNFIRVFIGLIILASAGFAQESGVINKTEGLAINGYDPVAYFQGTSSPGSAKFLYNYKGAVWLFVNSENRDLFIKNPEKYEPQFGGWCAWAVAEKNAKFPINPNTYKITNGKLYLFYNGPFNGGTFNALEPWNKDEKNLLKKSDGNWKTLSLSK